MDRSPESAAFIETHRFHWIGNPIDQDTSENVFGHKSWALDRVADGKWKLTIGTNVKNYDRVIDKFWAWISPWIDDPVGSVVGKCECENADAPSNVIVGESVEHGKYVDDRYPAGHPDRYPS